MIAPDDTEAWEALLLLYTEAGTDAERMLAAEIVHSRTSPSPGLVEYLASIGHPVPEQYLPARELLTRAARDDTSGR